MAANSSEVKDWTVRTWTIAVIVLTMIAASACTAEIKIPQGFEDDPLTVVRVFNDAMNAKMIDAALGLVDDDVIFIDATGRTHSGKTSIRNWMDVQSRANAKSEFIDLWVSGNTVTWTARILGRNSIQIGKSEAVVLRGKIKSLKVFDGK